MITKEYRQDWEKMKNFLIERMDELRKVDIRLTNDYDGPANIIRRMRPRAKPLRIEAKINDMTLHGNFKLPGELRKFLRFVTNEGYNVVITKIPEKEKTRKEEWLLVFTKTKSKGLILTDEGLINIDDLHTLLEWKDIIFTRGSVEHAPAL